MPYTFGGSTQTPYTLGGPHKENNSTWCSTSIPDRAEPVDKPDSKVISKRKKPSSTEPREPTSPSASQSKKRAKPPPPVEVEGLEYRETSKKHSNKKESVKSSHKVNKSSKDKEDSKAVKRTSSSQSLKRGGTPRGRGSDGLTPRNRAKNESDTLVDELHGVEAVYVPCESRPSVPVVETPVVKEVKPVIDLPNWKRPDKYVHTDRVHETYDLDERDDKWLRRLPAEFQLAANMDRALDLFELLVTHFEFDFAQHHRSATGSIFTEVQGEIPTLDMLRKNLVDEITHRLHGEVGADQIEQCYQYWCDKRKTHKIPLLRSLQDVLRPTGGTAAMANRGNCAREIAYAYHTLNARLKSPMSMAPNRGDPLPPVQGEVDDDPDKGQRMCDSCGRWGTSTTVRRTGGLCICRWCLKNRGQKRQSVSTDQATDDWPADLDSNTASKRLPCPEDYIGVVVEKTFSGYGLCRGTITRYDSDQDLFLVRFNDGDEEEYGEHEVRMMLTVPEQAPPEPVTEAGKKAQEDALAGIVTKGRSKGGGNKKGRGRSGHRPASPRSTAPKAEPPPEAVVEELPQSTAAVVSSKPCGRFGHRPDCMCHVRARGR